MFSVCETRVCLNYFLIKKRIERNMALRKKHMHFLVMNAYSTLPMPFLCSGKVAGFLLGAFAKMLKTNISFVKSVCLSVRKEQLGTHCKNFHYF